MSWVQTPPAPSNLLLAKLAKKSAPQNGEGLITPKENIPILWEVLKRFKYVLPWLIMAKIYTPEGKQQKILDYINKADLIQGKKDPFLISRNKIVKEFKDASKKEI